MATYIRDGPKFGKHRSSAKEFDRMFGSATCELFGRTSAKIWHHFCGSAFAAFCINLK